MGTDKIISGMGKMKVFWDIDALLHYPANGISVYLMSVLKELLRSKQLQLSGGFVSVRQSLHVRMVKLLEQHGLLSDLDLHYLPIPGRVAGWLLHRDLVTRMLLPTHTDLVHFPAGIVPKWFAVGTAPYAVTIHDLAFMRYPDHAFSPEDNQVMTQKVRSAARYAQIIFTVSEFTKREIVTLLGEAPEKIFVTPNAIQNYGEFPVDPTILTRYNLSPGQFFLAVGTLSPRKNYPALLRAFASYLTERPDAKLVVVGRPGWECQSIMGEIMAMPPQRLIWLRHVTAAELNSLYQNAQGFFLVSRYEGFGIPLLEAMHHRCPVCYGTGSGMDEIAESCGIGVVPDDVDGIVAAMRFFNENREEVQNMRERGRLASQHYSWRECAEKTLAVYRQFLS